MKPAAILFDLFGTLLDIASLRTAAAKFTPDAAAFVATWREKQLGYAFASAIMDRYENFDEITEKALRFAAARHGVTLSGADAAALAAQWRNVEPYPDARPALEALRQHGFRCAILTNGTLETANAALANAGIADTIDVTLTVDTAKIYKPSRHVYTLATEHYATTAEQLTFVTANGWDATGAAEFGLNVVWCNRVGAPAETFGARPAVTVGGLLEFVAGLTASVA
jgi:2-haloacid dehalogenase